jgi:hypothetical protein
MPIDTEPPAGVTEDEHARRLLTGVESQLTGDTGDFKPRLAGTLDHLGEGALPPVLIPVANVIEFLIDFLLSRLGAKARLVKSLVQNTSEYQSLMNKISSELAGFVADGPLDPNVYWQKHILNPLDDQVRGARNELIAGIYARTNVLSEHTELSFLGLGTPDKKGADFGLKREGDPMGEDYPAAQAYTVHGAVPARGRLTELPARPGQPLAAAVRLVEERRFGHDLKHVRLHTGAESESNLKRIGANAVTSGSHVFFRPGLDTRSALGARVLRHELTHVLQQTGPRPKGRAHGARPLRGRPRVGLIVDQMREAAAEAMANADSAVARTPIEVNAGAEGVQPDLEDAVTSVVASLTTFESAKDFDQAIGPDKVPGEDDAKAAWHAVAAGLKGQFKYKPFVKKVLDQLRAHIAATVHETDIRRVAALAQEPARGARGKKPKNTKLDFPRFVTLLEGFIFARSGVGMQLKLTDPPTPRLTSIEVAYVHFGVISPTSTTGAPLWDAVMKASGLATGDDRTRLRAELYARLGAIGADPFVWDTGGSEFRFSEDFVKAFNKVRVHGRKPELETQIEGSSKVKAVTRERYLDPSGSDRVGLLIGTHKDQKGTDRESHHTTQYLLIQYFRNNNSILAWRPGVDYPGIYPTTGNNRQFFQGEDRLELKELDKVESSRGAGMPAILLSADLHKRGRLHINRESRWSGKKEDDPDSDGDDEQGGGRSRQGYAIERKFKAALKNKFGFSDDNSREWADALKAKKAANKKPEKLIQDAMVETYHWMHKIMLPALKQGLLTRELAYYRGIAARRHLLKSDMGKAQLESQYELKADDMSAVYDRAKDNNDSVMRKHGWSEP